MRERIDANFHFARREGDSYYYHIDQLHVDLVVHMHSGKVEFRYLNLQPGVIEVDDELDVEIFDALEANEDRLGVSFSHYLF